MKTKTKMERARDGDSAGDGECRQAGRDPYLSQSKQLDPGLLAGIRPFLGHNGWSARGVREREDEGKKQNEK
jgi:hypothetical protein